MSRPVRVQVYTMQSPAEAVAVADLGVDHVGVTPSDRGLPGEVGFDLAHRICRALQGRATSVALSVESDPASITEMVHAVKPDILHLCGLPGEVGPEAVAGLRRALPGVAIMQAVGVAGPESVAVARSYERVADFLLLDSVDPAIPGVGAAGAVHDWGVSADIVAAIEIPVLLAGGLSPGNVAEAVAKVQPWGVDTLTRTNRLLEGGGFRKDLDLVRRFVAAARAGESS